MFKGIVDKKSVLDDINYKDKIVDFDTLRRLCDERWKLEVSKLEQCSLIPSKDYYRGYREALGDITGDLHIKSGKRKKFESRYKKSKGLCMQKGNR